MTTNLALSRRYQIVIMVAVFVVPAGRAGGGEQVEVGLAGQAGAEFAWGA